MQGAFSKESIATLIDKSANVSASELSFYFANYNNPSAILDAINFGENISCGYNPNFKDYGVISFDYNGSSQVVPNYAVPKINTSSLSGVSAVNNSMVLNNKSYYSYPGPDKMEVTLASVLGKIINEEELEQGEGILSHGEGIDLVPGNIELSGLEVSLVNIMSRH